jgi:hypothetical protein
MRKKDPDPYLRLTNPDADPGGQKHKDPTDPKHCIAYTVLFCTGYITKFFKQISRRIFGCSNSSVEKLKAN